MKRNIEEHSRSSRKVLSLVGALGLGALMLTACYREDASVLYSRQYVTAVSLADLQKAVDSTNRQLGDIRTLINKLKANEPVSDVTYVTNDAGERIGANVTFGSKTVYIPFGTKGDKGEDGKDGKTPTFTVGINKDGNWEVTIDGKTTDTGVPATGPQGPKGEDGKTPVVGLVNNPDDAKDTNQYWQISWPDGTKTMLKDAAGNYVRANGIDGAEGKQGIQGIPGVNSPIKNIVKNEDGTVTIETELKGLEKITLPVYIRFDIYPEASKLVDGTVTGKDYSARWNSTTEVLTFEPGETISFKYKYTEDDDLKSIMATVPYKWKYSIDQTNKVVSITAPSTREALTVADHEGTVPITAMTEAGDAYTRYIKIALPRRVYVDYFFHEDSDFPTEYSTSIQNEFSLASYRVGSNVMGDAFKHYIFHHLNDHIYFQATETLTATDLTSKVKSGTYLYYDKTDAAVGSKVTYTDFIYPDVNYLGLVPVDASSKANNTTVGFTANYLLSDPTKTKVNHIRPVPKDIYGAYQDVKYGDGSDFTTVHLRRLTQKVGIHITDPAKIFGLPSGETFNYSRLTVYHYSDLYANRLGEDSFVNESTNGRYNVTMVPMAGYGVFPDLEIKTTQTSSGATTWHFSFYTFPTFHTRVLILYMEYTRADGSTYLYVFSNGLLNGYKLPYGGGSIDYYIDAPNPSFGGSERVIAATPSNQETTFWNGTFLSAAAVTAMYPYK